MNREVGLFIVESCSHNDLYSGNGEADFLEDRLQPLFACKKRQAPTRNFFEQALAEADRFQPLGRLYLHISCHGSEDGVQLTNGDKLAWDQLVGRLPANRLDRPLILFLSCCNGLFGSKMAYGRGPVPFEALISHAGTPDWSETQMASYAFYWNVSRGATLEEAASAARAATRDDSFRMVRGLEIHSQCAYGQCADSILAMIGPGSIARFGPGRASVPVQNAVKMLHHVG